MNATGHTEEDKRFVNRAVEAAIRIALIAVLVAWCFQIVQPFITVMVWGIIIAIGVYPLFGWLKRLVGHRDKMAATAFALIALALISMPSYWLATSAIEGVQHVTEQFEAGTLTVPPPPDDVADWPLVGEPIHKLWSQASTDLSGTISQMEPQLRETGAEVFSAAAGVAGGVINFIISILIAAAFLANAEAGERAAKTVFSRIAGAGGAKLADLAKDTVNSVVRGVLGVGVITSFTAGMGMMIAGVPLAGLWAGGILVLSIIQLPPLIILIPVCIYMFSAASMGVAIAFTIFAVLLSIADSILPGILMGRGVDVPMLVIFLGALGGMALSGIVGLFVGAVILCLGYKLLLAWLAGDAQPAYE
jgi:predicted PurR-regulated permease PerM